MMKRVSLAGVVALSLFAVSVFLGGCASPGGGTGGAVPVYSPDEAGRNVAAWSAGSNAVMSAKEAGILKRGDTVIISLRDIMNPEDVKEMIDTRGMITLPYIGNIKVEGLSTAAAEDLIEREYVRKGIYKRLTAIVVGQNLDEYYITGEVKAEGRYPLAREMTLSQVIIAASGLTDFAKESAIQIRRGKNVKVYDLSKIRKGRADDPVIEPNDIISVPRSMM